MLGVGRHEVEALPHRLDRTPEHAEQTEVLTGLVLVDVECEVGAHHVGGEPVGLRCGHRGIELADAGARVLGPFLEAVGGVVGHLLVVAGEAAEGRGHRVEHRRPVHVLVGDLVGL